MYDLTKLTNEGLIKFLDRAIFGGFNEMEINAVKAEILRRMEPTDAI